MRGELRGLTPPSAHPPARSPPSQEPGAAATAPTVAVTKQEFAGEIRLGQKGSHGHMTDVRSQV